MNDDIEQISVTIDAGVMLLMHEAYRLGRALPEGDEPLSSASVLALVLDRLGDNAGGQ